ncbi:hypothetical protein ACHAWF_011810 [Thalassiosira exigua]
MIRNARFFSILRLAPCPIANGPDVLLPRRVLRRPPLPGRLDLRRSQRVRGHPLRRRGRDDVRLHLPLAPRVGLSRLLQLAPRDVPLRLDGRGRATSVPLPHARGVLRGVLRVRSGRVSSDRSLSEIAVERSSAVAGAGRGIAGGASPGRSLRGEVAQGEGAEHLHERLALSLRVERPREDRGIPPRRTCGVLRRALGRGAVRGGRCLRKGCPGGDRGGGGRRSSVTRTEATTTATAGASALERRCKNDDAFPAIWKGGHAAWYFFVSGWDCCDAFCGDRGGCDVVDVCSGDT